MLPAGARAALGAITASSALMTAAERRPAADRRSLHHEFSTGLRPTSLNERYITVTFIITSKIKELSNSFFLGGRCVPAGLALRGDGRGEPHDRTQNKP
jgi:hypothetical protein